jgi:hypothetical protein
MCRFCENPCHRDGGFNECDLTDAEFEEAYDDFHEATWEPDAPDWQDDDTPPTPHPHPK